MSSIYDSIPGLKNCKIVIVDNGNNKNLNLILQNFPVSIIERLNKSSASYARNEGAKDFKDGILVFIDSDVVIEKTCLTKLIEPIIMGNCDATVGNYSRNVQSLTFAQKYKQLYINHAYSRNKLTIINEFWTAISAIRADVFHKVNGFDHNFFGACGEDTDFGIRLCQNGFKILAVPDAVGIHKRSYTIKKTILNDFRKGIASAYNIFYNKIPMTEFRHSTKVDVLSVMTATLSIFFLVCMLIYLQLIWASLFAFILWIFFRYKLISLFYINQGCSFCSRALLLMFILDIVRALCVILCLVQILRAKNRIYNLGSGEQLNIFPAAKARLD